MKKDEDKTKEQLITELGEMRQRVAVLEKPEVKHKQTETIQSVAEENYQRLFELIPIGVTMLDMKGVIVYCNSAVYSKGGYTKGEVTGKHFSKIAAVRLKDIPTYIRVFNSIVGGKMPQPFETIYQLKDGTAGWTELNIGLIKVGGKRRILVMQHDITERKQVEKALQLAEQNFRNSLDSSPLGIRIITTEGELLYANQAILDVYGYSSIEELKAMPTKQRYIPESSAEHQERKERRKLGKPVPSNYEISIVRKDGEIRHLAVFRKEVIWNGEPQFQAIYQDITERKQAEEALQETTKQYATASRLANLGYWSRDFIMNMANWSNEVYSIFGVDSEEFHPTWENFLSLIHPSDREQLSNKVRVSQESGEPLDVEYRIKRPDGIERVVHSLSEVQYDEKGQPVRLIGSLQDITGRKQAEEALRESEENLRAYLESAPDGIYINDLKGTFLYGNKKAEEIMRYKREELIGKSFLNLKILPGKHLAKAGKLLALNVMGKPTGPDEFEMIRKDGSHVWVEINTTPIKQQESTVVIGFVRDITERKQAEEELARLYKEVRSFNVQLEDRVKERTRELEEAKQTAELADRAKSNFLASMSHELRTPLNAIIGFSQVLQEQYFGKLNEKQTEYVNDILESGKHLLSLITDILDFSEIEVGKMELELSGMKIKDLLESSLVMIKEKAFVHRIKLDLDTTADLEGLEIKADQRRLKQVMFNLLSNAAKFTPDGGAIRLEGRKEGKELIISVSDTGIGIAPKELERVFEEFYQATGGIKDKTPGTGLGLPLTRNIVEMHGGRIWVESEGPGKGSRFTFTLPV